VARYKHRVSPARRQQVFERDSYRCQECGWAQGDPVPVRGGIPLFRMLEIDHIYPWSLGGTNALANLRVLCSSCNARKGART
jgi:5-methylcytosine-specific restriction endonuclease McrA